MKAVKLTATLPDGRVATRTTTHSYTHVVAMQHTDPEGYQVKERGCALGSWGAFMWTTRPEKALAECRRNERHGCPYVLVPVTPVGQP